MKITSLLTGGAVLEFNDLGSYIKGVSYEIRGIRLDAGATLYLVETGDVLLSAQSGDIFKFAKAGKISVNDTVTIGAGESVTLVHGFNFQPFVSVLKNTGSSFLAWTGNPDLTVTHDLALTQVTISSAIGGTFSIRLN